MRSFAKLALVIPAFLIMMNAASAAFTFSLSPSPANVTIGSPQVFDIIVNTTSSTPDDQLFNANFSFSLSGANAANFTITPPGATVPGTIGTVVATVAVNATGVNGDTAVLSGLFSGAFGIDGGAIILPGASQNGSFSNSVSLTAVPEPSSLALVGLCVAGVAARRRRRA
jgi:hypothetical protein